MIEAILTLQIQIEQEEDGRWLAEVPELPGVMTYGGTVKLGWIVRSQKLDGKWAYKPKGNKST